MRTDVKVIKGTASGATPENKMPREIVLALIRRTKITSKPPFTSIHQLLQIL